MLVLRISEANREKSVSQPRFAVVRIFDTIHLGRAAQNPGSTTQSLEKDRESKID